MKVVILDVDGVMTDGRAYYSKDGKQMKSFGADDHDGLELLRELIEIQFVTADYLGFEISRRRIEIDMGFPISLVPMRERIKWMRERWDLSEVIYIGDGILDPPIFDVVGYSICPADGFYLTREKADYVTRHTGGHRAVGEACIHIKEKFFV